MADWEFELGPEALPEPDAIAALREALRRAASELAEAVELTREKAAQLVPLVRGANAAGLSSPDIASEARISTLDVERILAEGRLY